MQILPILDVQAAQLFSNWPHRPNGPHPRMPRTSSWHVMNCFGRCVTFQALVTNTEPDVKDFTTTQKDSPDRLTAGPFLVRTDPFRLGTEGNYVISKFLSEQTPTGVAVLPYCSADRQIGAEQCLFISWKEQKGTSPDVRLASLQRAFHRDDTVLYNSDFVPIIGYAAKPDAAVCMYHKIEESKMTDTEAVQALIEEHIKNCLGFRENKYGGRQRPADKYKPDYLNWTDEMINAPRTAIQQHWTAGHPYFKNVKFVGEDGFISLDAKTEIVNLPKDMKEVYNLLETKRKASWNDPKVIAVNQLLAAGLAKMMERYKRLGLETRFFSHMQEFTVYERFKMFVCPPVPKLAPFTVKDPDTQQVSVFGYEQIWATLSLFDMRNQLLALHFRNNMLLFTNIKTETSKKSKMCLLAIQATPEIVEFLKPRIPILLKKQSKDGKFMVICEQKEFLNNAPSFLSGLANELKCPFESIMSSWEPKVDEKKCNELTPREDEQTYSLSAAASAAAAAKSRQKSSTLPGMDATTLTSARAVSKPTPSLEDFKENPGIGMSEDE